MKRTGEMANEKLMVIGLFKNRDDAECAYAMLAQHGYGNDETDVMMSSETRDRYYSASSKDETASGTQALEGTGVGGAVGGAVGATIGMIAAIGTSIALPGLGLVIAGPLAAALVGAGAGGLTGGLIGALIGSGIPEDRAAAYESGIQSGGIVLRTHPRTSEEASLIESNWRECGGEYVYSSARTDASAAGASRL
ncbi:MAG TPA: hypothetical protein VFZ23_16495 [Pyrinomonadaceae bacterium]